MSSVASAPRTNRPLIALTCLAAISEGAYLTIAWTSQSLHEAGSGRHSLLILLSLFALAFGCYLAALTAALRAHQGNRLLSVVVIAGLLFRCTLLVSDPIEEIDIYRYLWDGVVTTHGISPFRYSPHQVLAATADEELPEDLARLVTARDSTPEMLTILNRIHFGQLPTIYPPVSQAVFALATWMTPREATLFVRMVLMRAWFVGFDLATLFLVIGLLKLTGRHLGLSVAYAWCPLLIKEVANSGHLDALAVFLTTLAVTLAAVVLFPPREKLPLRALTVAAAIVLSLAVAAKLYPIVLAPLLFLSFARRLGWRLSMQAFAFFGVMTWLLLWPMLPEQSALVVADETNIVVPSEDAPPLPPEAFDASPRDPSQSLKAFLSEWEMNDFLFLIVMENVRPNAGLPIGDVAWFSFVPEEWRNTVLAWTQCCFAVEPARAPFLLSRAATSVVFFLIALGLALRASKNADSTTWLRAAFLTVAWFWLLLPTLNPWYWTWALPILPFARSRAWLALSGLAFVYYLRFWLTFRFPDVLLLGTPYTGAMFFDYVVTWLEFGPWLVWLAVDYLQYRIRTGR